jgi:hypothetical protein
MRLRLVCLLAICAPFAYGCSDKPGPTGIAGPLDRLAIQSGGNAQRALAGTAVGPIVIIPQDDAGLTVVNQTATFTVVAGGGSLSSNTAQSGSNGRITAPTWTLGKSDVPQQMRVDVADKTILVNASVNTSYVLTVRFYGAPVSTSNQAIFTSAAARIRAFIVGQLPPVTATNVDMSQCTGTTPINETIQGTLIFASVDTIDGPGRTLAQAGPCYIRNTAGVDDFRTSIGIMKFDSADIANLVASGNFQEVITHEMMHVIGLGTFWGSNGKNLLVNEGTVGTAYTGTAGLAGCRALPGGSPVCTSNVPVEDCVAITPPRTCGPGNRDGHWREFTFGSELMTGYLNAGTNPLSVMTIRSFEDLGYSVNTAAADPYSVTTGNLSSIASASGSSALTMSRDWERPIGVTVRALPTLGTAGTTSP